MEFKKTMSALGISEFPGALGEGWDISQSKAAADGGKSLSKNFIGESCSKLGLGEETARAAARAGRTISRDPALEALYRHGRRLLNDPEAFGEHDRFSSWPAIGSLEKKLAGKAGMFYVVLLASGVDFMLNVHKKHSVPKKIIDDTLADVKTSINTRLDSCRNKTGCPGLYPGHLPWLILFIRGEIYRVGRLQFQLARRKLGFRVYRGKRTKRIIALAENGTEYLENGQMPCSARGASAGRWAARLEISEKGAAGHPVHPAGRAMAEKIFLPAAEWTEVLAQGDPVLSIHVPRGGPLDFSLCGQSLRGAESFFSVHFPEWDFKAFTCSSWLLDTRLQRLLPPESNIVRFQKEGYVCPWYFPPDEMLKNVFGFIPEDISTAPRDTSLRAALAASVERGENKDAEGGFFFILRKDLNWGSRAYIRNFSVDEYKIDSSGSPAAQ